MQSFLAIGGYKRAGIIIFGYKNFGDRDISEMGYNWHKKEHLFLEGHLFLQNLEITTAYTLVPRLYPYPVISHPRLYPRIL